jgi:hypothetical protein
MHAVEVEVADGIVSESEREALAARVAAAIPPGALPAGVPWRLVVMARQPSRPSGGSALPIPSYAEWYARLSGGGATIVGAEDSTARTRPLARGRQG